MSRLCSSLAAAMTLAFAGVPVAAQQAPSWDRLIAAQWPGSSIRKVSEAEFLAFVKHQPNADDRKAAVRAFLRAQYLAYGLPADASLDFPVPSGRSAAITPGFGVDSITMEGPEPNGDPNGMPAGTPTPLNFGDEGHGVLAVNDSDWWTFTAPIALDAMLWIGPGSVSAPDDVVLTVYDSTGVPVAFNDDYHHFYAQVTMRMQAGATYYFAVEGFDPATDFGDYTLDFVAAPVAGSPNSSFGRTTVPEGAEPNDNLGTPTPINCGEIGLGNLQQAGDTDWWGPITVPAGGMALAAEVDPPLSGTSELYDSVMDIVDPGGVVFATDDDGGPRYLSRVAASLPAGTYYVVVRGYNNAETGDYALSVDCSSPWPAFTEAPEQNGSPFTTPAGTPTVIPCGSVVTGNLAVVGDQDWYRVVLPRGGLLYATTDADPNATQNVGDTVVYLRDGAGNELANNDDIDGQSTYSRVQLVVPAGTYYLDVRGYQNARGAYQLTVECRSGFAGVVYRTGGCPGSNGTPLIYARYSTYGAESFEAPALGSTFSLDVAGMPQNGVGVMAAGLSDSSFLGTPLPLDLGLLGAPGCMLETSIELQSPLAADAQGDALWQIGVPYRSLARGCLVLRPGHRGRLRRQRVRPDRVELGGLRARAAGLVPPVLLRLIGLAGPRSPRAAGARCRGVSGERAPR